MTNFNLNAGPYSANYMKEPRHTDQLMLMNENLKSYNCNLEGMIFLTRTEAKMDVPTLQLPLIKKNIIYVDLRLLNNKRGGVSRLQDASSAPTNIEFELMRAMFVWHHMRSDVFRPVANFLIDFMTSWVSSLITVSYKRDLQASTYYYFAQLLIKDEDAAFGRTERKYEDADTVDRTIRTFDDLIEHWRKVSKHMAINSSSAILSSIINQMSKGLLTNSLANSLSALENPSTMASFIYNLRNVSFNSRNIAIRSNANLDTERVFDNWCKRLYVDAYN